MPLYYDPEELEALPTLCVGQADDLKIDTGEERVWLSRMTPADGEVYRVHVERLLDGMWTVVSELHPWPEFMVEGDER